MYKRAILAALLSGLGLAALGLIPSGVMRASGSAFATGAFLYTEPAPALQGQPGRPVRTLPDLRNITVWAETSRGPTAFTLGVNGSEFTTRRNGPLSPSNKDFFGAPGGETGTEFYDVFYSNADGAFNIDGSYITVEAGGAGLRLSEIWLQFSGAAFETGNVVASFVAFGIDANPDSVGNAIDNNIDTFTRLGSSVVPGDVRRRITIGFASSSQPPPSAGPTLFIEDVELTEGDGSPVAAEFRVRLSNPSGAPVRVDYSTQDFTATAANDYIGGNGTLAFNSGDTLNSIVVTVKGDTRYEAAEQFYVNLSNPVNASIGRAQGTCTILDNEPGTLKICSTDVPKRDPRIHSTITVNRDAIIDDVDVSLFLANEGGPLAAINEINLAAPDGNLSILINPLDSRDKLFGTQLGTTCSPSPNCVFDQDAARAIQTGSSPYVGSFRPDSLFSPRPRKSPRGTWALDVRRRAGDDRFDVILNCWCLTFDLPREGCRLAPASATVPIFIPHSVKAFLTSNGDPVINQVVSFTVRGEHDELKLREDVASDDLGVAELSYYDFKPGLNFIEARAMMNGVPSIAKAQVTWVADGLSGFFCPVEQSTAVAPGGEVTLSAARNFRDGVLARTPRGNAYTRLYYDFSTEAVQIMMFNPMLILRSREIIERYKPVLQAMTNNEAVALTQGDLDEIDDFMKSFAAKGSPELQEAIKKVSHDLRDPQLHSEFGITVTDGPKRRLSSHDRLQTVKQISGVTLLLGLSGLVLFAVTGTRRKALRKHAGRVLVVVLSVAVLAYSTGPAKNSGQGSVFSGLSKSSGQRPVAGGQLKKHTGSLPITFEPNQGQIDSQVKFVSRGQGYTMFLTPSEAVMTLTSQKPGVARQKRKLPTLTTDHWQRATGSDHRPLTSDVLRMKLTGANPHSKITGLDLLPGATNYFIGNDQAKWRANVPNYAKVKYEAVYPGVDMIYYGNQQKLEYDFLVAPGSDPDAIGLAFDGSDKIEVDAAGDLVLSMPGGEVRQRKPVVYQDLNGRREEISCRYTLGQNPKSKTQNPIVKFDIGQYDRTLPLVIDPVLQYSTYLGGRGNDEGNAITVDSAGNAYVIGFTDSINFPTSNAAQPAFGGGLQDAFVAKLDSTGTQLLYSTFIGGNGQDNGSAIAVDAAGNAYVTGYTGSTNFPAMNAMQPANRGRFNAFVAKLNPAGGLLYSTHLGGSAGDFGSSIAVDAVGNVYVAGVATSPNFPLLNAVQTTPGGDADVYIAKLNPSANQLVYSTYLGGAGNDGATSLVVDSAGDVYLTGVTTSHNFRTANPLQAAHAGGLFDAFVSRLNSSGTQLVYSTYFGGSGEDRAFRIAVDAAGNAYVTGDTDSINFPTTNALQRNKGGGVDAFVAKLNPSGSAIIYSTYLGGSSIDGGTAIAVDSAGSAYVTGFTGSRNFPTAGPLQQSFAGGSFDGFVARLNPSGAALDYSTYLGGSGIDSGFGIAADASGSAYVMGLTDSLDFPTAGPLQSAFDGGTADLFVAKIASRPTITRAEIQGKHLLLFGNGFDEGAKILIDGQEKKTRNDEVNPTGALFGKKGAKKINDGQTVTLQVRNSDGSLSNEFSFTRIVQ